VKQILAITSALADAGRLRVLLALRTGGELCVCQVVELLALAPSTVSKHLAILHQAGLVEVRKAGRWAFYRLADAADDDPHASPLTREAIEWLTRAAAGEPRIRDDERRLQAILKENPEELCRRQMGRPKCCSSAPATPAAARWRKGGRVGSRAT
jgi:DNA-binding transcriptional ArsR family regulator